MRLSATIEGGMKVGEQSVNSNSGMTLKRQRSITRGTLRFFCRPNDDEGKPASWQKMRKGVSASSTV
ncbi:MAG: hypothetical protein U0586_02485 [Candidatus Brocadiaceae bacterium]